MISKQITSKIAGRLQQLQPKILVFTFGASLLPIIFLLSVAWRFVYEPLMDLEKTRLDDQVLAFRGYTAATAKGLQDVVKSYAVWTDLYDAVSQRNRTWIEAEVVSPLVLSTDVDTVQVMNRQGETLGKRGTNLRSPFIQQQISALNTQRKPGQELVALSDSTKGGFADQNRQLLILAGAPIFRTDGKGNSPGNLIIGQTLNDAWLRKFLDFSQPTTRLEILSLTGRLMVSSSGKPNRDAWEETYLTDKVLLAIGQGQSVYRIEPTSGVNTIYAPLTSDGKPVAIAKIQISSEYFQQASVALTRAIWVGLCLATLLSIAVAHRLAKQIGEPLNQLAERSKTLAAGDLNSPIPGVGAGGELGQLANSYQEMAQALKALIDNLEQRVAERTQELELSRQTLEERVQQRTKVLWLKNEQLQKASDQLQQLNSELTTKAEQLSEALRNLKKAQAQLVQTEKMSSLGQLVAGIAHEINNPVNFIHANLTYVRRYMQDLLGLAHQCQQRYSDPEIQQYIENIELDFITIDLNKILSSMQIGTDRISQIVLALRNFSRLDEAEMKPVNLHEGINNTLLILQNRLKTSDGYPDIQVVTHYGNLPLIECYPRQMNQVFMHIISNAIDALNERLVTGKWDMVKYLPDCSTLREGLCPVAIAHQQFSVPTILIQTQKIDDYQISIRIWNNGPEIPQEIKDRIFDPFFTTKPVGRGTGLGLSVCYQIVQKHGGNIDVVSETAHGTEFAIALPIKAEISH